MDKDIEEQFLNRFIEKRIRERLKFEIFNKNYEKRLDGIWRFCHRAHEMLIPAYIYPTKDKLSYEDIMRILIKLGAPERAYVISVNRQADGKYFELAEALDECYGFGFASIMVCSPYLAYIECEQSFGPPDRYIVYRKSDSNGE